MSSNLAFCGPALESQKPAHHPKCGFLATPAVGHLEGPNRPQDIVAPSLDGHLYAFRADGTALPGLPGRARRPGAPGWPTGRGRVDQRAGDRRPDGGRATTTSSWPPTRVRDVAGPSDINGGLAQGFADITAGAAGGSTRVYAFNGPNGKLLPGWPIHLNGAIQNELPLVGPGHDPAIAKVGGQTDVVVSSTGGALSLYDTGGHLIRSMQQGTFGPGSNATDRSGALNLFESASVGDLRGDGTARRRQVRGDPRPAGQPGAGRPERPLQPPDRRL